MKSAYSTLGVPGNASTEDIERAFQQAQLYYSHERIGDNPALADKFVDIRNAYKVLRDPEQRAAHDRKLVSLAAPVAARAASRGRPAPAVIESSGPSPLMIAGIVIALLIGGGMYLQVRRENARQEEVKREAEQAHKAAEADRRARQQEAEQAVAKAKAAADAERQERRDSEQAIYRANAIQSQRDAMENQRRQQATYEERRRESEARATEQRRVHEAQRRLAADKASIRELCYLNYRRSDC
ncbi:MAG: DnaJ domain-containing protein [Polaromonas sp.]